MELILNALSFIQMTPKSLLAQTSFLGIGFKCPVACRALHWDAFQYSTFSSLKTKLTCLPDLL